MINEPGVYQNLDFDEYTAIDAVNNSTLSRYITAPILAKYDSKISKEAADIGRAVHLILEPDKIEDSIVLKPLGLRRGTEAYDTFYEQNAGKIILTEASYSMALGMLKSLVSSSEVRELVDSCEDAELSVVSFDEKYSTGLLKKCRVDAYSPSRKIAIDIKTCADASPSGFAKSYANYGYYRQAAFYTSCLKEMGLPAQKFYFICVEKSAPYLTAIYQVNPLDLLLGDKEIKGLMTEYKQSLETDVWSGYTSGVVNLPAWKRVALEELPEVF